MPIVGLTDQKPKLPSIGVLRKGAAKETRKKDGKEYQVVGKDLDYFRFDTEDAEAKAVFEMIYGAKPRTVRVVLPHQTIEENWEAWKEHWVASSLKHRCDGQTTVIWQNDQGLYVTDPDKQIKCPGKCKQVGRLTVIIPELKRWATITVLTTSIHDILEIQGNLESLAMGQGQVRGIPLLLRRVEREISTPRDGGKRQRVKKWLLNIEAQPKWFDLALSAAENAARALQGGQMLALPPAPIDAELEEEEEMPTLRYPASATEIPGASLAPSDNHGIQLQGLDAALLDWAIKSKGERAGKAYFEGCLSKKNAKEREQFANENGIKWTDAPLIDPQAPLDPPVIDAEPVDAEPDEIDAEMHAAIDSFTIVKESLAAAGMKPDEIAAEVKRLLPKGVRDITDCTHTQIDEVITGLNFKLQKLQNKAA